MEMPLSKAKLASYRKLLTKKGREQENRFIIEGWHLLDEALQVGSAIEALVYDEQAVREDSEQALLRSAIQRASLSYQASAGQLSQLSDTKSSQGVLAVIERVGQTVESALQRLPKRGPVRLVLLDEVNDPGNCGTIIRTSDWFGMDAVVLGAGCAELENGKTARSTMGGLFHLPIAVGADLTQVARDLQELGIEVFTTELDESARSLAGFRFPERCALVIGNEARGVTPAVSQASSGKLFAPRFGSGESLNAGVAAAVFLSQWRLG